MKSNIFPKQASDKYWKENLSEESYRILREKGTEPPFSGKYNLHFENGYYLCKACENPLFKSGQKFDSGCGWPSFDDAIKGSVKNILDKSHGMIRTEIVCNNCGGHLGHVFNDGPIETTGKRHCINGISLKFTPTKTSDEK